MKYINESPTYRDRVTLKYSTAYDAFATVKRDVQENKKSFLTEPAWVTGGGGWGPEMSFFPYADRLWSDWSGFFSSRPCIKRYFAMVEAALRAAEAADVRAYTLATIRGETDFDTLQRAENLNSARENLYLVLHHDAITGTCAAPVLLDYANHLTVAYNHIGQVLTSSLEYLLIASFESNENVTTATNYWNYLLKTSESIPLSVSARRCRPGGASSAAAQTRVLESDVSAPCEDSIGCGQCSETVVTLLPRSSNGQQNVWSRRFVIFNPTSTTLERTTRVLVQISGVDLAAHGDYRLALFLSNARHLGAKGPACQVSIDDAQMEALWDTSLQIAPFEKRSLSEFVCRRASDSFSKSVLMCSMFVYFNVALDSLSVDEWIVVAKIVPSQSKDVSECQWSLLSVVTSPVSLVKVAEALSVELERRTGDVIAIHSPSVGRVPISIDVLEYRNGYGEAIGGGAYLFRLQYGDWYWLYVGIGYLLSLIVIPLRWKILPFFALVFSGFNKRIQRGLLDFLRHRWFSAIFLVHVAVLVSAFLLLPLMMGHIVTNDASGAGLGDRMMWCHVVGVWALAAGVMVVLIGDLKGWLVFLLVTCVTFLSITFLWPHLLASPVASDIRGGTWLHLSGSLTAQLFRRLNLNISQRLRFDTRRLIVDGRVVSGAERLMFDQWTTATKNTDVVVRVSSPILRTSMIESLSKHHSPSHAYFTDAGLGLFIRRDYDNSGTVTANYVPSIGGIAATTTSNPLRHPGSTVAFVTGQTLGVTRISTDSLEIMIHRRLMQDDQRGLQQNVDDTSVAVTSAVIVIGDSLAANKLIREAKSSMTSPIVIRPATIHSESCSVSTDLQQVWSRHESSLGRVNDLSNRYHLLTIRRADYIFPGVDIQEKGNSGKPSLTLVIRYVCLPAAALIDASDDCTKESLTAFISSIFNNLLIKVLRVRTSIAREATVDPDARSATVGPFLTFDDIDLTPRENEITTLLISFK